MISTNHLSGHRLPRIVIPLNFIGVQVIEHKDWILRLIGQHVLDVLKRFVVDIWDDVAQLIYRQVAEVWAVVSVAKLMKIYFLMEKNLPRHVFN